MKTFNDLGLSAEMLMAVGELGFTIPTSIQEKTIPAILGKQQDIIALAQTGTGKTAAFGLPVIQQIEQDNKSIQVLILCPTRELCLQITNDLNSFSKFSKKINIAAVYGGASIENQIRSIKKGAQIIAGTPGRTLDLIKRKVLNISRIKWLILDEADEMLNMGFREDLDLILETTPLSRQTLLFSATMSDDIRQIAAKYMKNPSEFSAGKVNTGADMVLHHYYIVGTHDRYTALKRLADMHPSMYALVFCRTRAETRELADKFMTDGYNADALHGDLSQPQRDIVMNRFRTRQIKFLVATDVAARGLDINDLTHVINYNLPEDPEVYIHRSGRTGRAGKTGISIIISTPHETGKIRELERIAGKKFQYMVIPTGQQICEKRLFNLIDIIENTEVNHKLIEPFMDLINKRLGWIDSDDLLKRFVFVEFQRFLNYYKDDKNINASLNDHSKDSIKRKMEKRYSRFFINVGSKQKLKAPNLIGLINENTRKRDIAIGKIDISHNFSFFEVEKEHEHTVLNAFRNSSFGKVKLLVQLSKSNDSRTRLPNKNRGFKRTNSLNSSYSRRVG